MSQRKSPNVDAAFALQHEDEAVLIDRVSSARRSGTDDQAAVDELLRRAAAENKAALDRLSR
jgi:microcompartment protein CcmK/EutM